MHAMHGELGTHARPTRLDMVDIDAHAIALTDCLRDLAAPLIDTRHGPDTAKYSRERTCREHA